MIDATVPGPHGPVPIRVYHPPAPSRTALVWAHGGGFRHGDLNMAEAHMVATELAARAGATVISVGYRLAVDGVRYPIPIDDVHAVWSWLTSGAADDLTNHPSGPDRPHDVVYRSSGPASADDLARRLSGPDPRGGEPALGGGAGGTRFERLALGGASAGAALALATAIRARDAGERTPDRLLLAYPFAHFPVPTLGLRRTLDSIEDMVRNYVGRISDLPPDALPGAARLDGLPHTLILLSEHDDLRPSGELLERQLRELGVPVESLLIPGTTHGHLNRPEEEPGIDESLDFFAGALREAEIEAGALRGAEIEASALQEAEAHPEEGEARRWLRRTGAPRIEYGADYNPEQWPREVWKDDVDAMREAGVTIVSLGIFSWAHLEPADGEYDFGWLDEIMDLLHENGILVDLATATASPPPWLTSAHPEILPVDRDGRTLWPGGRQHWRPTSPVFRAYALRLVEKLATRYRDHPALTAWHVNNELGCHNVYDYSDDAAAAFRDWLRDRYGSVDALNDAWGTAFWSQRYTAWEQILPPRLAAAQTNPTQQLDFKRFSSDALKDHLRAERRILREITPDIPVTTNFMVAGEINEMNYADWAAEVDFLANDHYVRPGPQARDELSFSANLTGNLAAGRPWFLMEHSTSAVNWQPVNLPKLPGELARDALTHVAHGADAVCFFQWRQSRAGAEKYHSAMLPHAGRDSAIFRSVTDLGARLAGLGSIAGLPRTPARTAILVDWESWWAAEQDSHPTSRLRYRQEALDWYTALLDVGVRADVIPVWTDLTGYDVVVAPILHMVPAALRDRLTAFAEGGGHLVTTYFSAIVDENDHVWLGGYPGALRDLLGIRVEEFEPTLDDTLWTEQVEVTDPATERLFPSVTRRPVGEGSAAYVASRLGPDGIVPVLAELLARAGVESELPPGLRGWVELAVRGGARFYINRTDVPIEVDGAELPGRGVLIVE